MKVRLHKQFMDTKQREIFDSLLLRDSRVEIGEPADYCLIDSRELVSSFRPNCKNYIVADLGDLGNRMGGFHQKKPSPAGATYIYLKVEWTLPGRLVVPKNVVLLTCPMLLGGSAFNIYFPDKDGDYLFSKNLVKNPKDYKHDWAWIGYRSSQDRKDVFAQLSKIVQPMAVKKTYGKYVFVVTKRVSAKGQDARENMDFNIDDMLNIFRETKVNIACNGNGVWCLKEGELLSRNCFTLRQHHPHLFLNPLTPKNGKHWVVFKTSDLLNKIKYYLENEQERERINDAGFEYFKNGIMGGWAKYYTDKFIDFLRHGRREVFGDLLWGK